MDNGRNTNGTFAAGHGGYKKKGAPEFQRATRDKLWQFFESKMEELPDIFDELSPSNKAKVLLAVAEFFLPKQREYLIEDTRRDAPTIDYTSLSQSTLKEILNHTTIHQNDDN